MSSVLNVRNVGCGALFGAFEEVEDLVNVIAERGRKVFEIFVLIPPCVSHDNN